MGRRDVCAKKIGKIGRAHSEPIGIPFKLAGRKRLKLSLMFLTRSPGNAERAMFRDGHAKRVCSTLTNTPHRVWLQLKQLFALSNRSFRATWIIFFIFFLSKVTQRENWIQKFRSIVIFSPLSFSLVQSIRNTTWRTLFVISFLFLIISLSCAFGFNE